MCVGNRDAGLWQSVLKQLGQNSRACNRFVGLGFVLVLGFWFGLGFFCGFFLLSHCLLSSLFHTSQIN